jgi:hypothetical protein
MMSLLPGSFLNEYKSKTMLSLVSSGLLAYDFGLFD